MNREKHICDDTEASAESDMVVVQFGPDAETGGIQQSTTSSQQRHMDRLSLAPLHYLWSWQMERHSEP